ncbi:MAG: hypothetical protein HEQ16_07870 [Bosea sp.]|jgi:hypothetical protein|nr:hypothetical protein [Bosea sp. (in: a-proteobacteria)]
MTARIPAGAVEAPDTLLDAMTAAHKRADAFYAKPNQTLIDRMSAKEWNDALLNEPSLVSDQEGMDCADGYDDCEEMHHAA